MKNVALIIFVFLSIHVATAQTNTITPSQVNNGAPENKSQPDKKIDKIYPNGNNLEKNDTNSIIDKRKRHMPLRHSSKPWGAIGSISKNDSSKQ